MAYAMYAYLFLLCGDPFRETSDFISATILSVRTYQLRLPLLLLLLLLLLLIHGGLAAFQTVRSLTTHFLLIILLILLTHSLPAI